MSECIVCDGTGELADETSVPSSYFEPVDYVVIPCDACGGTGVVVDIEEDTQ